ncbi:MAG: peptide deformylase [Selenomonadaceae bacterium]|nr:peptide deformylase [Selenomonadaceae bacterium]
MAILEIKKMGDPVLKQICTPVDRVTKKIKILLDDMAETMYKHEGVGIAAPQVGIPIRAIVVDVGKKRFDIINPVITERVGTIVDSEGCLSFPGVYGEVERAEKVRVEYMNRYGKKKFIEAEGLLARCLQHEVDHLDGHLFIEVAKNITADKKNRSDNE